ncbi:hypothetical protein B0H16DRAFT_1728014 [Mycena metata]|uniref:Uncharacterized protein n=1 Tax=Mycena metata TaxID=1033252 RepID=A0AAD7IJK5_9AGAR|nr:hypothetical protein B0H16DRAFT_1728014 [Mycena metata]
MEFVPLVMSNNEKNECRMNSSGHLRSGLETSRSGLAFPDVHNRLEVFIRASEVDGGEVGEGNDLVGRRSEGASSFSPLQHKLKMPLSAAPTVRSTVSSQEISDAEAILLREYTGITTPNPSDYDDRERMIWGDMLAEIPLAEGYEDLDINPPASEIAQSKELVERWLPGTQDAEMYEMVLP